MISVFLPQYERTLKLQKGENLLELFQKQGFYLQSDCAGNGTCGKCKIKVENGNLPISDAEKKHISTEQLKQGVRLSCRTVPESDCTVQFLAEESEDDQILTEGQRQKIKLDPVVKRVNVQVEKPELANDQFDFESLKKSINLKTDISVPVNFLQKLPKILRENEYQISVIHDDHYFIDVEPTNETGNLFGLAIDVGTTTIVVKLIDLQTGIVKAVSSGLNPQQRIGADVISRIGYSQKRKDAFKRLQKMVVDRLNKLIGSVTLSAGISPHRIYDLSIVGNTVMEHLLLALDSTNLAQSPYTPVVKFYPGVLASEIGLSVNPNAKVHLLPNIGRFVGGDTTAVILATGVDRSEKLTLVIDIGTNGEIVLGNKDKLLAASTAAGPAFEGARIRFGMRATEGAIDRVTIHNGELTVHSVENAAPKGICGSGIISLIGELIRSGVLSWTGQLLGSEDENGCNGKIHERVQFADNEKIFLLHQSKDNKLFLSQRDVREVQLAKSAIRSGINLLLTEFGVTKNEIDRIFLAGAFGNFLDREQAIRIGLLPEMEIDKIRFVGNAACAGAELCLLSREMRLRVNEIAENTQYVEIATHPKFYDEYTENMLFGES